MVVIRQHSFHPIAFHPPRGYGLDTNLWAQLQSKDLVRLTTADLPAAYGNGYGPGRRPTILAVFAMLPLAFFRSGKDARVT
jgi:hypothetical protein